MGVAKHGKDAIKPKDKYISNCKLCLNSIFSWQKRVWICHSVVGLVHEECYDAFQSSVPN